MFVVGVIYFFALALSQTLFSVVQMTIIELDMRLEIFMDLLFL